MNWKYNEILDFFNKPAHSKLLKKSNHGLERECLRIDPDGKLASTPHPQKLGSALTNPYITTDFSEAQLELITPPSKGEKRPLSFLKDLHVFIGENLKNELIWPFSMPCILSSAKNIPLAQYGKSDQGKEKTKYREGLKYRYGSKMQTVSGTHYNFSFDESVWKLLHKNFAPKQNYNDFVSDSYLHMIRNFLRYSWLNTYLFGASPAVDKTYFDKKPATLKRHRLRTLYGEYATSLRMSDLGYYTKVQKQLAISFDDLKSYQKDLKKALNTPSPYYKGLPGLNENMLQISNEHYSRIRPKAIKDGKINYVEVRAVDLNPYSAIGLSQDQICFLHTFLIYCLFNKSPKLSYKEMKILTGNQNSVALYGRKPGLKIMHDGKQVDMLKCAEKLIKDIIPVGDLLDKQFPGNGCCRSIEMQLKKISNSENTPSAQILKDLRVGKMSFAKFGLKLARMHDRFFRSEKPDEANQQKFIEIAEKSHKDREDIEIRGEYILYRYEDMEYSTQFMLREARRRGVKVEILDRKDNFLRLSKGRKVHYVKQATKTSLDPYISAELMGNKYVSKLVLAEHGIRVPEGELYNSIEDALDDYERFKKIKVVVKPIDTNYGIGISFVKANSYADFTMAIDEAFKHAKSVIVEEFVEGEESRLLVIDDKVISIIQRIPANVEGDGEHTIKELLKIKNEDPNNHKYEKYYGRLGNVELDELKKQKLKATSILKKGQVVFLRTNSNVSTGGDPIAITDQVPEKYKKIAVKAAQAAGVKICGVDMIIGKDDYVIIEINYNPALQMHEFPYRGPQCRAAAAVFDLLGL